MVSRRWHLSQTVGPVLQAGLPWDAERVESATLPMALLIAVVRKEAQLPAHTAAFAATQLLPVIQAATRRHLAATQGQETSLPLCKELLVSSEAPAPAVALPQAARVHACVAHLRR